MIFFICFPLFWFLCGLIAYGFDEGNRAYSNNKLIDDFELADFLFDLCVGPTSFIIVLGLYDKLPIRKRFNFTKRFMSKKKINEILMLKKLEQ